MKRKWKVLLGVLLVLVIAGGVFASIRMNQRAIEGAAGRKKAAITRPGDTIQFARSRSAGRADTLEAIGIVNLDCRVAFESNGKTLPLSASTKTFWPSFNSFVALPVPTMQGFLSSRATMAAWDSMPPWSVTIAAAFCINGT